MKILFTQDCEAGNLFYGLLPVQKPSLFVVTVSCLILIVTITDGANGSVVLADLKVAIFVGESVSVQNTIQLKLTSSFFIKCLQHDTWGGP